MKKKSPLVNDDEIYLIDLIQIIWEHKFKILLITIISFLIGCGYFYQKPKSYINSLNINKVDNSQLFIVDSIKNRIILNAQNEQTELNQFKLNQFNKPPLNKEFLNSFINELKDYEEFILILKNSKKVKESIKNLSMEDQEIKLFKYANLLEIVGPKKDQDQYLINFKWDDPDEARKILKDTLDLTYKNLQEFVFKNLNQNLENIKKIQLSNDSERLVFLREQSSIAEELGIHNNQLESLNLPQANLSLNIPYTDVAYYFRGSKAINKEIELTENRSYAKFEVIEQEINTLKKKNIKLVNYNIYLTNSKNLNDFKLILIISIVLGLIAGFFFVFIYTAFQSKNAFKKTN